MPHINLLPWREALRRQRQREFLTFLGAMAIGGVAVVAAGYLAVGTLIQNQTARNDYLTNEIRGVDQRIKEIKELEHVKQALIDRMDVIQQLQKSRPEVVHIFDEIVKTLPDGVFLTSLVQKSDQIAIEGKAESDARVSAYMRNLEASPWFKSPRLSVIETRAGKDERENADNGARNFALTVFREAQSAPAKAESKREGKP